MGWCIARNVPIAAALGNSGNHVNVARFMAGIGRNNADIAGVCAEDSMRGETGSSSEA